MFDEVITIFSEESKLLWKINDDFENNKGLPLYSFFFSDENKLLFEIVKFIKTRTHLKFCKSKQHKHE